MVPVLGASWLYMVHGQAFFMLLAAGIWYWLRRRTV
jgi:hypothetical protein